MLYSGSLLNKYLSLGTCLELVERRGKVLIAYHV